MGRETGRLSATCLRALREILAGERSSRAAGNDDWKSKLPPKVTNAGIATLQVDAITDDETAVLSEGNRALAIILSNEHPARGIARNLFYLSRMIELGAGQPDAKPGIATEMDLARLWWRYGGGRGEDDGRFARLKVLRAMAGQLIVQPGRVAFDADDLASPTVVAELFDSIVCGKTREAQRSPFGMMCYATGRLAFCLTKTESC